MNIQIIFEASTMEEVRDQITKCAKMYGGENLSWQKVMAPKGRPTRRNTIYRTAEQAYQTDALKQVQPENPAEPILAESTPGPLPEIPQEPVPEQVPAMESPQTPAETPHEAVELSLPGDGEAPSQVREELTATRDQAHAALLSLRDKLGMTAVKNALATYGATKLSGVPESELGNLVGLCKAACDG